MSQTAAITLVGSTSPLGVSLVPFLTAAGYKVNAVYRNAALLPADWWENKAIEPVEYDLSSPGATLPAADAVIWLAHLDAGRYNEREVDMNLAAFEHFLSQISSLTEKMIFVSSGGSVYGNSSVLPIPEDHPREPLSTYGQAKKALEDRLMRHGRESGIATAILRPGNIYGFERPDRKTKGVTAAFLRALTDDKPFTIIHRGQTVRDLIYVDDVSRAVICALRSEKRSIVWNVGTGTGTSTSDVLELILELTGRKMPALIDKENFSSDVLNSILDVSSIAQCAGWRAEIPLSDGMRMTVEHWRHLLGQDR